MYIRGNYKKGLIFIGTVIAMFCSMASYNGTMFQEFLREQASTIDIQRVSDIILISLILNFLLKYTITFKSNLNNMQHFNIRLYSLLLYKYNALSNDQINS